MTVLIGLEMLQNPEQGFHRISDLVVLGACFAPLDPYRVSELGLGFAW